MRFIFILFPLFFAVVLILMIATGVWNFKLYRDCRSDGHTSYQCNAMINGDSRYNAVDDLSNQ